MEQRAKSLLNWTLSNTDAEKAKERDGLSLKDRKTLGSRYLNAILRPNPAELMVDSMQYAIVKSRLVALGNFELYCEDIHNANSNADIFSLLIGRRGKIEALVINILPCRGS
jgi:hypothetical protein